MTSLSLVLPLGLRANGPDTLSAVDLYGLRTVSEVTVRAAIGVRPGDPVPDLACPILYIGIREIGTPAPTYGAAPTGAARLPDDILAAGAEFDRALMSAVRPGSVEEDRSRGYALARDSAMRAAQVVAYGADREAIVRQLLFAIDDPDDHVRNNAVRALGVLAEWANQHPEATLGIPVEPFIELVNSVSWTDRNKGVLALLPDRSSGRADRATRQRLWSLSCGPEGARRRRRLPRWRFADLRLVALLAWSQQSTRSAEQPA